MYDISSLVISVRFVAIVCHNTESPESNIHEDTRTEGIFYEACS